MLTDSAASSLQTTARPGLELGIFSVELEFPEPPRLPVYLGAVLHAALGRAARKTV